MCFGLISKTLPNEMIARVNKTLASLPPPVSVLSLNTCTCRSCGHPLLHHGVENTNDRSWTNGSDRQKTLQMFHHTLTIFFDR